MEIESLSILVRAIVIISGAIIAAVGVFLLWLKGIGPVGAKAALQEKRLGITEQKDRERALWRRLSWPLIIVGIFAALATYLI